MEREKARGRGPAGRRFSKLNVLCQDCGKTPATVSLTEIVNGAQRRVWLCAPCLEARSPFLSPIIPQAATELPLNAPVPTEAPTPTAEPSSDEVCPSCGMTMAEFREKVASAARATTTSSRSRSRRSCARNTGPTSTADASPPPCASARSFGNASKPCGANSKTRFATSSTSRAAKIRDRIRDLERADSEESHA
jgi:protein arginine kinase activator